MKNLTLSSLAMMAILILGGTTAHAEIEKISEAQYLCIADGMQAYNSDIFYNLAAYEIDQMLTDEAAIGHDLAVMVADTCGLAVK